MEKMFNKYCDNHIFKKMYTLRNQKYTGSFLLGLEKALSNLRSVNKDAYKDFINHKLKAKKKSGYDAHALISSLCELSVINTFLLQSDKKETFKYEPKLRSDSNKNVEFSIEIGPIKYNVEVKSPNFDNYNKKFTEQLIRDGHVTCSQARLFSVTDLNKNEILPAPDSKVKDFLVDANNKFPIDSNKDIELNILFICWNENYDQACTALKHPLSGLLTNNSWYTDSNNNIITFSNIDLIFVTDLYKSIIVHMCAGDSEIPSIVSGIPYLENRSNMTPLTPFLLPFSRFALIKPEREIKQCYIDPIPVAFFDTPVDLVDENFVSNLCPEFITTFTI